MLSSLKTGENKRQPMVVGTGMCDFEVLASSSNTVLKAHWRCPLPLPEPSLASQPEPMFAIPGGIFDV